MSTVGSFGIFGLLDDATISFELLRFGVEIRDSNRDLREFGMVAESFPGGDSFRLSHPSCTDFAPSGESFCEMSSTMYRLGPEERAFFGDGGLAAGDSGRKRAACNIKPARVCSGFLNTTGCVSFWLAIRSIPAKSTAFSSVSSILIRLSLVVFPTLLAVVPTTGAICGRGGGGPRGAACRQPAEGPVPRGRPGGRARCGTPGILNGNPLEEDHDGAPFVGGGCERRWLPKPVGAGRPVRGAKRVGTICYVV
uniref:(northern house mosquito) hypothetical protein n=2 Tax=Culex pipiens TaxID=7175 RepID=A0A8D8KLR0_CULPI